MARRLPQETVAFRSRLSTALLLAESKMGVESSAMHAATASLETNSQPRVGAGVLLVDESGRVLLTLRKFPPEAECWSIVGGKVDFLETVQGCAIREAREEVGLRIAIERLLCVTDHLLPDERQHWVSPAYLGRILEGKARNCEPQKTREVRWFGIHELPHNLTMTARNAIEAYERSADFPSRT
jgi:8-oxo-dGTP diphosphatase